MKLILLLVLPIVSAVLAASESPDSRIVGGSPTTIYDYPFVASLVYADPKTGKEEQKCVGSIISSWHVLTTAHCFTDVKIEDFTVRVGSTNSLEGGKLHKIYFLIVHPDYKESPRTADISIALLYNFISIADSVNIVYIPPQETYISDGYTVRAVGWGYGSEDGPKLDTLNAFDTKTISQQQCTAAYADDDNISVYDQVICTQAPNRSMCRGNSGTPLIIDNVLVGIASYTSTCDDSTPDVFTRIDRHTGWILQEAVPPYGRSVETPVGVASPYV